MSFVNQNTLLGKLFFNQGNMPLLFATFLEHKLHQQKISDIILPILHIYHTLHEFGKIWPKLVKDWVKHANVR